MNLRQAWQRGGKRAMIAAALLFIALTILNLHFIQTPLSTLTKSAETLQILDRNGIPLTVTYQNRWNTHDARPLYNIPQLLKDAFVASEDKRFLAHHGIDWQARGSAVWQNISSGQTVRGASTITEQVVRMANPRKRNLWSKWLETFEAYVLERHVSKSDILEFYLNQLPYAANRRGVAQGARYYFNRDLSTLTTKEMLALVVLARAPSGYDLYKNHRKIDGQIAQLAAKMGLTDVGGELVLEKPAVAVNAEHFASYVRQSGYTQRGVAIASTLDANLQSRVQDILDTRVRALAKKNLSNAAALVVDHTTGDIVAWVVAGANDDTTKGRDIDAVNVPRQPGSALKPFLYASALDKGWTAATILDDNPMSEAVGTGLHKFKNYSNTFYGRLPLREALGNSLNIPAVLTVEYVGAVPYLKTLHRLGFESLTAAAEIYDDGLALGVGEVTLRELVQGYVALANKGLYRPLRFTNHDAPTMGHDQIFRPETASLITNILSDPNARRMEFGAGSVLNMPLQTAAKTGTSTDYRDAWAVAYNDKYVVGIWMGNLDHTPTDGITGATGPALALRSILGEVNKNRDTKALWLSPKLIKQDVCIEDAQDADKCYMRSEYFAGEVPVAESKSKQRFELVKPTDGLQMAVDPRIPLDRQKFEFLVRGLDAGQSVEWILNGKMLPETTDKFLWSLARGKYVLQVNIMADGKTVSALPEARYVVK